MRLLADENIANLVVQELRTAGHDVLHVKESMRGEADQAIFAKAMVEQRVVVTFDKDFGELAFRAQLPSTCGVVLFRITQRGRTADAKFVLKTLASRQYWAGFF